MRLERWDPPLGEMWNFPKETVTCQIKFTTLIRKVSPAFPSTASLSKHSSFLLTRVCVVYRRYSTSEKIDNVFCVIHLFLSPLHSVLGKCIIHLEKRKLLLRSSFLDFSVNAFGEENGSWHRLVYLSYTRPKGISQRRWKIYFRRWSCVPVS